MPLMRQNAVVPFGKYRGQQVEQLAADPEYCEWLMGQSWFVEKYQAIHTVIINNFGEPSETPEHNRLQLRFLDETFRDRCAQALVYHRPKSNFRFPAFADPPIFEDHGWDVTWTIHYWGRLHTDFGKGPATEWSYEDHETWRPGGESVGPHSRLFIECKPCLGDDFPAVLRQMKSNALRIDRNYASRTGGRYPRYAFLLLAGEVQSDSGTIEQIKQFFLQSGFFLRTVADIEQTEPLPYYEESDLPPL
jgi:hypothetical protein